MLCIIGEPTELKPVLGHKGKLAMRCDVHGQACHSAYAPQGVNAIEYAAELIGELGRIGQRLKAPEHHDARFDPPFSTVQTGVIAGGKALNIVPADCRFDFEIRALPSHDPSEVAQALNLRRAAGIAAHARRERTERDSLQRVVGVSRPGNRSPQRSRGADRGFSGSRAFGTVAFGTEGGLFDAAGIPTVVCGPGSMDQGHKPDEFVSLEQ
jgi:acetylornithine deacetylase